MPTTDSIQTPDSLQTAVTTVDTITATEPDSIITPVAKTEKTVAVETIPPAWESGLEPEPRPGHAGHNQGIVASIVFIMLAVALSFGAVKRVLGNMSKRLTGTRIRDSFDTDTGAEKRTTLLLLFMTIAFMSILTTAGMTLVLPEQFTLDITTTGIMTALISGYFVFQYVAYRVVGYTFSTEEGSIVWIRGFTASMIMLGIGLILPGITVLFYPDFMEPAVWVAATLYVIARVLFISKGFRIFYTNIASLIYFILYLCTLELVPICVIFYFSTQVL